MSNEISKQQAKVLFERAYKNQMRGNLTEAIYLYQRSIETHPLPEAYTFLGWTYSLLRRYQDAIDMCHEAIKIDPDYGNPYNDIGAYLIELEKLDEAIEWLEKATKAVRYDAPQYPYYNLGRIYQQKGRYQTALQCYNQALVIDPLYFNAIRAKYTLLGRMN
ncbi:MAG TPA: tetratricopeptide repeat protein [Anaerolineae bacterium]|nr:tetratricopeptide repeat protein [Anaerolineae bacterium]